jgi:hypothetical protein
MPQVQMRPTTKGHGARVLHSHSEGAGLRISHNFHCQNEMPGIAMFTVFNRGADSQAECHRLCHSVCTKDESLAVRTHFAHITDSWRWFYRWISN